MKRMLRPALLALMALSIAILTGRMLVAEPAEPPAPQAKISVVTYGSGGNEQRWRSLDRGIRQACGELGIESPAVTVAPADDPGYQLSLLRREVENGSKGLIIAAADTEMIAEYLGELPGGVSAVLLEGPAGEKTPWIGAANAAIGRELADYLAREPGVIAVLEEGLARGSVAERYNAFRDRMAELGREVVVLKRADPWVDLRSAVASELATQSPGIDLLAVLDNDSLEAAIDALPASMVGTRLCGVGSSEKVVHALDEGVVEYILFQNEYAAGYLATVALAGRMGIAKPPAAPDIGYVGVTREILYNPEIERLLFPITQ